MNSFCSRARFVSLRKKMVWFLRFLCDCCESSLHVWSSWGLGRAVGGAANQIILGRQAFGLLSEQGVAKNSSEGRGGAQQDGERDRGREGETQERQPKWTAKVRSWEWSEKMIIWDSSADLHRWYQGFCWQFWVDNRALQRAVWYRSEGRRQREAADSTAKGWRLVLSLVADT